MSSLFKHIIISVALLFTLGVARADGDVSFEINTPLMVTAGEMFRVEFVLTNAKPDSDSFHTPSFEGLEVLAGPTTATGHSFQSINGVSSSKSTYTITYVVVAQNAGNITITPAELKVDGKRYTTKATPIEVVAQSAKRDEQAATEQSSAVQSKIAQDDILLKLNLSRSTVYQGEPIRASLTLYTRASIAGLEDVKLPSFNGFWSQELPVDNYRATRESVGGKVYDSQIIKEYLLYPQQTGTITIESADITAVAQVVMRSNRAFDPFFGGGSEVYNVPRKLSTGAIPVTVKALPEGAPASFNGAVGSFTMDTQMPPQSITANSAASYVVKISGTGNLTFLQAPKLALPSSFELYDVRSTEAIRTTVAGTTGYRQFEYPFIARAEGDYDIAPLEFTYFSPEKQAYVTLASAPMTIAVAADGSVSGSAVAQVITGTTKEGVRQLGSDIRFIKLGDGALRTTTAPLLFSTLYFVVVALLLVAAVVAYVMLRRAIRDSKNVVLVRNRRANKVAVQRFRAAERFMREQNRHAFFEEMLRALWGYMSDKLNIPVSDLTKDNIREQLQRRGCSSEDANRYTDIISRCDEAQYSPAGSIQMSDIYAEGVNIISRVESIIKR